MLSLGLTVTAPFLPLTVIEALTGPPVVFVVVVVVTAFVVPAGFIVTVTEPFTVPPAPVHVRVYITDVSVAETFTGTSAFEPFDCIPVPPHPSEAVHDVVFGAFHCSVVV